MNRKLIFLDIDGTLLPPGDMLIPDSTLQALRAARANGHKLFLCTGRNLRMTAPLLEYGCFDGAICSAGGYVLCDGQVLVDLPMEPEQCSGLSAVLEQHGVDYTLESRDDTFAGPKMTARWKFTADAPDKPLNSEAARWRKAMQDGMSLPRWTGTTASRSTRSCTLLSTCAIWTRPSGCIRTSSCSARAIWTPWMTAW